MDMYELNLTSTSTKQFLFGAGFAGNHPGKVVNRRWGHWRSALVPDLFGPVWVWNPEL